MSLLDSHLYDKEKIVEFLLFYSVKEVEWIGVLCEDFGRSGHLKMWALQVIFAVSFPV